MKGLTLFPIVSCRFSIFYVGVVRNIFQFQIFPFSSPGSALSPPNLPAPTSNSSHLTPKTLTYHLQHLNLQHTHTISLQHKHPRPHALKQHNQMCPNHHQHHYQETIRMNRQIKYHHRHQYLPSHHRQLLRNYSHLTHSQHCLHPQERNQTAAKLQLL